MLGAKFGQWYKKRSLPRDTRFYVKSVRTNAQIDRHQTKSDQNSPVEISAQVSYNVKIKLYGSKYFFCKY